jgi:hypothetical protein
LAWQDKNSKDLTNNTGYENLLDVSATLQEEWNCIVLTSVHPTVRLWNCRSLHWAMLVSVSETTWAPPLGLELACLSWDSPVTIYRPRYGQGRKCGFAAVNSNKNLFYHWWILIWGWGLVEWYNASVVYPATRHDVWIMLCYYI